MKLLRWLLTSAPLLTLGAAFIAICVRLHTAWPWNAVVHEDGRRTLLETVFYFRHALGELPLEPVLAAAVAGAPLRFRKPIATRSFVWVALVAAIAIDALILIGWLRNVGYEMRFFCGLLTTPPPCSGSALPPSSRIGL